MAVKNTNQGGKSHAGLSAFSLFLGAFRLALMCATPALLRLSMPGCPWPMLIWIALVPWMIAGRGIGAKGGLFLGLLVGWATWFTSLQELPAGFGAYTGASGLVAWGGTAGLSLYNALPFALFGWLWGRVGTNERGAISLPWALVHCLGGSALFAIAMSLIPTPLPVTVAHALYPEPIYLQLAEYGGVPLLTFAVLLVNVLLAEGIAAHRAGIAVGAVVFLALFGFGTWRMVQVVDGAGESVSVGIVSPNVAPMEMGPDEGVDTLVGLTERLLKEHPQVELVVWPEVPFPIFEAGGEYSANGFAALFGRPLVYQCMGNRDGRPTNSSQFALPNGTVGQRYDKRVLVPFAEYLPFAQSLPFVRTLLPGIPEFAPGKDVAVFGVTDKLRVQPLICYEATDPATVREGLELGANVLVNLTNDAWLSGTTKSVHLALSVMRAVEFRMPLVRSANGGFSCLVDPAGRISASLSYGKAGGSEGKISTASARTLYARQPYVVLVALIGLAVLWMFGVVSRKFPL